MTGTGTQYVSISRRALDLEDYIDIARRHVGWIIGPAFAGLVVSVVVANFLPNTYISRAVMQITPATISDVIVTPVSSSQLTERVVQMQNEILSRTTLGSIINDPKLQLYADDLKRKPLEDVIEQMRSDIHIQMEVLPGASAKRASAFTIQFSYTNKYKARDTVQTFVTKFNEVNLSISRTIDNSLKTFVDTELAAAKANLDQLDEQLTKFRQQYSGKLPEEAAYNMSQLTTLQTQANALTDSLNRAEQNRMQVDAALNTARAQKQTIEMVFSDTTITPPPPPSSPAALKNEELANLVKTVKDLDTRIGVLRQSFADNYPTVREALKTREFMAKKRDELQKEQDAEEAKQRAAAAEAAAKNSTKPVPKTTDVRKLQALEEAQGRIDQYVASLEVIRLQKLRDQEKLDKLNAEMTRVRNLLAETPGIDLGYKALERQEQNAQTTYQELLKKQHLTQQSEALNTVKAAENLEVLDPPSLPEQPSAPKRPLIIGAGAALSIVLGFVMAAVREAKDASLKNLKDVRAYTNMPVLSSIPLLENALLVRRKRRITYLAWSAAVIVGAIMVSVSLYYHYAYAA